ncbi:hypothetical protein RHGRI_016362 [Rhododendron griersonianum]|uniref:Receptor-like serine/threonine-protein kinase n=1 Tax=Rhododendron griersonianum TaxID=479676 RepID=A0AAV6JTX0_9ERIC|nr:hypothetical protein RHGRI_016362 [Rhododendron griersonianum]
MDTPILVLIISLLLSSLPPLFSISSLNESSSLSVSDVLISENGIFSAGFYSVGKNAYCFSIWFTEPTIDGNLTVVWMANRDQPVNGRRSKLSLLKSGNLKLTDAALNDPAQFLVWSTNTKSISPLYLQLLNTGNLVLQNASMKVWESFDSPTDTLLPNQPISRNSKLVSSRSPKNFSSGFYALFFDSDNVLRLLFDGAEASSLYWPDPWLVSWQAGRSTYNNSPTAAFNSSGYFRSSDHFKFKASDYGIGVRRRLRMDVDGNVRLYSLDEERKIWNTFYAIVGQLSIRYKAKNLTDWSLGCEPEFNLSCNAAESGFIRLPNVEFYGYDFKFYEKYTYERCKEECLQSCKCYGFNFRFNSDPGTGYYNCYLKSLLLNGYRSPSFGDPFYLRLPKASVTFYANRKQDIGLHCPPTIQNLTLDNRMLQFMVWFASAFGGFEIICICFIWLLLYKTQQRSSENTQSYLQVVSGFRKFTYDELKKATRNFREEIGRGGSGIVYKGVLSDRRVAAIKRLNEANQGEAEFLAERGLVKWVREKMNGNGENELWLEEIIDPVMKGKCDLRKMEILVLVALECVKEDKDARPTMTNGIFSAGFHNVGENAYCFSIWFNKPTSDGNLTVVWMANRDQPVNGRRSKLSLLKSGDLKLTDAAQFTVWSTNTKSPSPLQLQLLSTGNLVLRNQNGSMKVWESFDSPTDTLLPNQPITRNSKLVSSRSHKNFSSGFYTLFFDYDNVLRLLFDDAEASSLYWPDPWLNSWEAERTTYNNSPTAIHLGISDQVIILSLKLRIMGLGFGED